MPAGFIFTESKQYQGVLHWRYEFERDTELLWIPVPYDDLLLVSGTTKHSANFRRPSSASVKKTYPKGSVIYGTRAPLNTFVGLHDHPQDRQDMFLQTNSGVKNLSTYVKNVDKFLGASLMSIDIRAKVSGRTMRRRIKSISGLSKSGLRTLLDLHDFLSTACGYGHKVATLTNSISPNEFYDQSHFTKKFSKVFGCSPIVFFEEFNYLPEQLLTVSYKHMPNFCDTMETILDKEMINEIHQVKEPSS